MVEVKFAPAGIRRAGFLFRARDARSASFRARRPLTSRQIVPAASALATKREARRRARTNHDQRRAPNGRGLRAHEASQRRARCRADGGQRIAGDVILLDL